MLVFEDMQHAFKVLTDIMDKEAVKILSDLAELRKEQGSEKSTEYLSAKLMFELLKNRTNSECIMLDKEAQDKQEDLQDAIEAAQKKGIPLEELQEYLQQREIFKMDMRDNDESM